MLVQICMDYHCLPDMNTMTFDQIRFFYNPILPRLLDAQKKEIESQRKEKLVF